MHAVGARGIRVGVPHCWWSHCCRSLVIIYYHRYARDGSASPWGAVGQLAVDRCDSLAGVPAATRHWSQSVVFANLKAWRVGWDDDARLCAKLRVSTAGCGCAAVVAPVGARVGAAPCTKTADPDAAEVSAMRSRESRDLPSDEREDCWRRSWRSTDRRA